MRSKEAWGCLGTIIGALITLLGTFVVSGKLNFPTIFLFQEPNMEATVAASPILYRDSFGNPESGWRRFSETYGSADYGNGEYVLRTLTNALMGSAYGNESFTNVRIQVIARNTGQANDAKFGLACNIQKYPNFEDKYLAGISSDGYYAIIKYENGIFTYLSDPKNNSWLKSSTITINAPTYKITFECAFDKLTLYVDGKKLAAVNDANFTQGSVGVFLWPHLQSNAEVRFDSIVITAVQ